MPGDRLFAPIFTTDALLSATDDRAWLQAMLDAEAALVRAEADLGLVPPAAAAAIVPACAAERYDPAQIGRDARAGGNPLIPLVTALRALVPTEHRSWVHWGATSQDIIDTAAMLVTRRALELIEADVTRAADACAGLAETHRHTLMAGRTLLQHALPTTFGLKAAGWLMGLVDARTQLRTAGATMAAQLGGAAGTLASLGDTGPAVAATFAAHLGLAEPVLPWHTARQRIAGLAGALGTVAGTGAKVARDIALLMQTEVGEASEPAPGGSSTLPHKRNPVAAAAVEAAARRALALLPVLHGALISEHERPLGAWPAEWQSLSEMLVLAGGVAGRVADTVAGLEVDADAMAAGLARTGGRLLSERVALALAEASTDRDAATAAVTRCGRRAQSGERSFAAELAADELVGAAFDRDQIDALLEPEGYLGSTQTWIDRALAAYEEGK